MLFRSGNFVKYSHDKDFLLIVAILPQKDDVLFVRRKGHFYKSFIDSISRSCKVIDLMPWLLELENLDEYYSDNNEYGGHYSAKGNKYISDIIYENLINNKII